MIVFLSSYNYKYFFFSIFVISWNLFSRPRKFDEICGVRSKFRLGFEFRRHDRIAINRRACSHGIRYRINLGSVDDIPVNYQPANNTRPFQNGFVRFPSFPTSSSTGRSNTMWFEKLSCSSHANNRGNDSWTFSCWGQQKMRQIYLGYYLGNRAAIVICCRGANVNIPRSDAPSNFMQYSA